MRTFITIVVVSLFLAVRPCRAQDAPEVTVMGGSDAVRLLPAPPFIKQRTPARAEPALQWMSPGPQTVLFRPATITLDWSGGVPAGTTYSVAMSDDGTTFNTLVAEGLTDSHLRWDLPDLQHTTLFLRVKGTSPNGATFVSKPLPVRTVPADAIVVSKENQVLWAFRGGMLHQRYRVSTGQIDYDTRAGWFTVYSRQKMHHSSIYDIDMPFALFFSGGQAIHSSTALRQLGSPASHGCVRLPRRHARTLFDDSGIGRPVIITDWHEDMSWLDAATRAPIEQRRALGRPAAKRFSRPALVQ
jgi:hypothetical protein